MEMPRLAFASQGPSAGQHLWRKLAQAGASKVFIEALGRFYATKGSEVVCIRFGGVNPKNKQPIDDFYERVVWLSHSDCVELVRKCIEVDAIPNKIHDCFNHIGWMPRKSAAKNFKK